MGAPNVMKPRRGCPVPCGGRGPSLKQLSDAYFSIAGSELGTVAAVISPCSWKAHGSERWLPRPLFEVATCNLKAASCRGVRA